jgi:hypothetical protein
MTLFVDTYVKLLCHMSPINITMETYMQVLQKMLIISNYYKTYMQVLQWMLKKKLLQDLYVGIAMDVKN